MFSKILSSQLWVASLNADFRLKPLGSESHTGFHQPGQIWHHLLPCHTLLLKLEELFCSKNSQILQNDYLCLLHNNPSINSGLSFLVLFCKRPQIWPVQPHWGIDTVYTSIHGPLRTDEPQVPGLRTGEKQLATKTSTAVTRPPCPMFMTTAFTKKVAISKGTRSTWKGCVSSLLQIINEGSRDTRDVQQKNNKHFC